MPFFRFIYFYKKEVIILSSMIFMILFQVLLIALNAVFASAEIAVLSTNEAKFEKLAEQGNRKSKRLLKLIKNPAKFLATIQVAITLSGFLGSAFAAENFSEPIVKGLLSLGVPISESTLDTIAVVVITLVLSYFTLILGELVPKRIAMKKSEKIALSISALLSFISIAFSPIVAFLSISTNFVLRIIGINPDETDEQVSEEEIRMMVDAGSEIGAIDAQEKEFIHNLFEFDDIMVEKIATHRTDVDIISYEDTVEEWDEFIHNTRHTYYPICKNSKDDVIGILSANDYFRLKNKTKHNIMEKAVKTAYFIPETIKADVLFKNMKAEKQSIAVVTDEYGGMTGIITITDLVEELVGEFTVNSSNEDNDTPQIIKKSDSRWFIVGNVELWKLEEETGIIFDTEKFDTFSGLVFDALETVPKNGRHRIEAEFDSYKVIIHEILEHQITKAEIILIPKEVEKESNDD